MIIMVMVMTHDRLLPLLIAQ